MLTKNELRIQAKQKRKTLDMMEISAQICEDIENSYIFHHALNVMLFYPLKYEIDLTSILTIDEKNFFLPRVNGNELEVCPYKLGDKLELSAFKTFEPVTECIKDFSNLDIIFIPALMADDENYRLGYGGGFYDRFLSKVPENVKKIIVIPKELIVKELPHDAFDIKADIKICENILQM